MAANDSNRIAGLSVEDCCRTASPIASASTLASDANGAARSCDDVDEPGNLRIVARPP